MSALATIQRPAGLPAVFNTHANLPDMNAAGQAGMAPSFAVVGYKGSKWHLKHRGDSEMVMDPRTNAPAATLNVIIVGVSPVISKQFYAKKFVEGDDQAPDCFSINGVTPDEGSPAKQCATCAVCPQNVWGSRITEAGKKAKACQDSRRIAVVPAGDVPNEGYGGPMLLRIPPTSLANYAGYSRELTRFGVQPYQVETQLGFDYDVAYPLLTFKPIGYVTSDETAMQIVEVLKDDLIERMLNTEVVEAARDPHSTSALAQGAPSAVLAAPAPAPAVAPVAPAPVVVAPTPVQPQPTVTPTAQPAKRTATSAFAGAAQTAAQPAAPAPAQVAAPVAPVQTAPAIVQAEPPAPAEKIADAQVQPAPDDLSAAIDSLLGL